METILLAIALIWAPQACAFVGYDTCDGFSKAQQAKQDDGFGACPAFSHYHAGPDDKVFPGVDARDYAGTWSTVIFDGLCHRDDNDSPIAPRAVLPKWKPDPEENWL